MIRESRRNQARSLMGFIAASVVASCSSPVGAPSEGAESETAALLNRDTFLYLRCNATSWAPNELTRLQSTTDPTLFKLTYDVTQSSMLSDACIFTQTNQLDGWGTSQTSFVPRSSPVTVPGGDFLVSGSTNFSVRYPALGRYTVTFNGQQGTFLIQPVAPAPTTVLVQRSLLESNAAALTTLSARQTFDAIAKNGNVTGGAVWHDAIFRSMGRASEFPGASGPFCDSGPSGLAAINGFPTSCPAVSAESLVGDVDLWKPLAAANRFDLAPLGGETCGEQRISFSMSKPTNFVQRAFLIFEAVIPNPHPENGLEGCRPIANFWAGLSAVRDPAIRATRLAQALYTGEPSLLAAGITPFMSFRNLTTNGARVRTNVFGSIGTGLAWDFREFRLQPGGLILQEPVAQSAPESALTTQVDPVFFPKQDQCRQDLVASVPLLLASDPNVLNVNLTTNCFGGESMGSTPRAEQTIAQLPAFASSLVAAAQGSGLTATQVAARIQFAGTCAGCHQILPTGAQGSIPIADLGAGMLLPANPLTSTGLNASDPAFVMVNDQILAPCSSDGTDDTRVCRAPSAVLRSFFLPHRKHVFENYLNNVGTFGPPAAGQHSTKSLGLQPLARSNP